MEGGCAGRVCEGREGERCVKGGRGCVNGGREGEGVGGREGGRESWNHVGAMGGYCLGAPVRWSC